MSDTDARTEIENLMNAMIPLAIQKLEDAGEFAPFGGAMSSDGDIFSLAETNEGEDALADPDEMIESLKDHMRGAVRAGDYKATAIVFDVEVKVFVQATQCARERGRVQRRQYCGEVATNTFGQLAKKNSARQQRADNTQRLNRIVRNESA